MTVDRSHSSSPPPDPSPDRPAEVPFEVRERLLVRLSGDLTTKGRATRSQFVRRLARNLGDALRQAGVRHRVTRTHDRLHVACAEPGHAETLARVFGVQSLSRVERRSWRDLDEIVEAGVGIFGAAVRGRRFAVRARRVGDRDRIAVDMREIERRLGARLLPESAGVDLSHPEVTAALEVTPDAVHWLHQTVRGPGGLPVGAEGRALALVSGGFDSAVAAWLMLKRGVALDHVFCNLGGRSHQLGTLRVMKVIADRWSYGSRPRFHAIDFDAVSRQLRERTRPRYWQVLLKRLMYRAAECVAAETRATAAVTGEAIGQVSSQTLSNLAVISRATDLPVMRPLVGFNKDEILGVARAIGTYDLSKVVDEYCAMVPRRPATAARLQDVLAEEQHLDPALLERAVAERHVLDLRELDLDKLDAPELEATGIPDGAVVLDLRSSAAYRGWHYPGALLLDFAHALSVYPQLERGRTYVLYCEFGLKSAHLAELMRAEGLDAVHFRRGLRDLFAWARSRGVEVPESVAGD